MRVMNPATGKYEHARRLTSAPPSGPAAVCLYDKYGRARVLSLDFDAHPARPGAPQRTAAMVTADLDRVSTWIRACGGRVVADASPSGGAHLYVPLAHGESVTPRMLEPVLRLLAARCPTLDITHALNPRTGCLTTPGTRTRDGGHRRLLGTLDDALRAFADRSRPLLLDRLRRHLGDNTYETGANLTIQATGTPTPQSPPPPDLCEGSGDNARLLPRWRLRTPLPPAQTAFATTGALTADGRWPTRSEARHSLLTAAALRGYSLGDIITHLPRSGGDWHGFADAYTKYGTNAGRQLRRDWDKACTWAIRHAPLFLGSGHKNKRTGGSGGADHASAAATTPYSRWLSRATTWADGQFKPARRATIHAVLQALAYAASHTATLSDRGTPTVEFGIRSLSLAAGLLPRTTIADALAELRDLPGSPILRIRRAHGPYADRYALVTPHTGHTPTPAGARVTVQPIHDAWQVIGLRCRRVYELIATRTTPATPAVLFAAAHISSSAGYDILATLATTGLITRNRGEVTPGTVHLDDIAHAHDLPTIRTGHIDRITTERATWRTWLAHHDTIHTPTSTPPPPTRLRPPWTTWADDHEAMWRSILRHGAG